jgi:hypothetical protein
MDMTLMTKLIAAGLGIGAITAAAAPAQAQTRVAVGYSDGSYAPVQYYRDGHRYDRRGYDRRYDRHDRWDNRRGYYGWNGRNSWNNDRRYRQRCWTEWRRDGWRGRHKVRICR